jgi:hypothetical protein
VLLRTSLRVREKDSHAPDMIAAMMPISGRPTSSLEAGLNLSPKGYLAGILVGLFIVLSFGGKEIYDLSEYEVLYAGARLVGTPYLYDKTQNRLEEVRAIGASGGDELIYSRPPFVAAFMAPLGRLPYRASVMVFQALSFLSLIGFILLWPGNSWLTALACAWSMPLALCFGFVRDDCFLLLLLALVWRTYSKKPFLTGILLSLLGIKFHIFLLLPLLFLGQKRWRMGVGFAAGCTALLAVSFTVAGADWPVRMAEIIKTSTIEKEYTMPNIRGILQAVTPSLLPEIVLGILVAAVVFWLVRGTNFEYGMCATIVGSLLVSHHAGIYDCAVLIPVLLILGKSAAWKSVTWLFVLLSPIPYVFLSFGSVPGMLAKLAIVSILPTIRLHLNRARSSASISTGHSQVVTG